MTASPERGIPAYLLLTALLGLFALDNFLLLAFLGTNLAVAIAMAVPVTAATGWLCAGNHALRARIPATTLAGALALALALFILGGEGRLVYANPDWQLRDSVLADMARNPWPYAYDIDGWKAVLRAPLGLYLLPALAGDSGRELAMLASNTFRLGLILALAAQLFPTSRGRLVAAAVFVVFSGLDSMGMLLHELGGFPMAWDHLEKWNGGLQYSSTLTLAFWVPNHAIAGWACALAYLLWLRRRAPVGVFAATIALTAIWSPFSALGALPFALHAAVRELRERSWTWRDLALSALAALIAVPSAWYLRLDAAGVGAGFLAIPWFAYAQMLVFEVVPIVAPLLLYKAKRESEPAMLLIALACLLLMPWFGIGPGTDFQMRASIPALTVLTFAFAEWLADLLGGKREGDQRKHLVVALATLAIGAATPVMEVRRALANPPSPEPGCTLAGIYNRQTLPGGAYSLYFASADAFPGWIGPFPVTTGVGDTTQCWDHPWVHIRA